MKEEWKDIPDYEGLYQASDLGRVKNKKTNKILAQSKDSAGYPKINLSNSGVKTTFLTHRLILNTFVGEKPEGMECRHLDGNKTNNKVENLSWGTSKENTQDCIEQGTFTCVSRFRHLAYL